MFNNFFDRNQRQIKNAQKTVEQINSLEFQVQAMSYAQIQERVAEMRDELRKISDQVPQDTKVSLTRIDRNVGLPAAELLIQKKLVEFLPEFYAFVKDTFRREAGIKHYDVQLTAGVILAQGQKLTELRTGEGKTMTFMLPLFLYSLVGRGAHMVTVNDYLAKRDAEYAGHIAHKLGLTVGVVAPNQATYKFIPTEEVASYKGDEEAKKVTDLGSPKLANMQGINLVPVRKQDAYGCDVTYSINNELGFDYLRDNMAPTTEQMVQRELYFCIVDEADSILIDEARTPLIISAVPEESDTSKYKTFASAAKQLKEDTDYTVDHKTRSVMLTEDGIAKVEKTLGVENLWSDYSMAHHLENALKAKALFNRDDHYLVNEGEVMIVDSFTGRVMKGRRYSEGLHQAIEAKEGVEIMQENKTYATISFQNFFRLYKVLCGGSGTVMTEEEEFFKIYALECIEVPTNKPIIRDDRNDLIYKDQETKIRAIIKDIKEIHKNNQPILVGTTSIEKSETISRALDESGIAHEVLNAKYHEREAQIVAKAGQSGAITVATNMAGRGTDIPLGEGVIEAGGLAVIGTERHDARRIDNQLRGRSGRQGDPGMTRFYVALDDTIMRIMGGDLLQRSVGRIMDPDAPIELGLISKQIETAQKRVEWANFDERKRLVDYDDVMNKQREVFYTRRHKFVETTDKAMGKFEGLDIPADQQESVQTEATEQLKSQVKDYILDELGYITQSQFAGDKTLSEEDLSKLVDRVLDMAPDNSIAQVFDIPAGQIKSRLADELRGREETATLEYLQTGFQRLLNDKFSEVGSSLGELIKVLMLESMDKQWVEHLETMADIRSGIGLQGYAQRNPLVEYKSIAFRQFEGLVGNIDSALAKRFLKVVRVKPQTQTQQLQTNADQIQDIVTGDREMRAGGQDLDEQIAKASGRINRTQRQLQAASGKQGQVIKTEADKIGRNDLCPCGSGKKYKKCGMLNTDEHNQLMSK